MSEPSSSPPSLVEGPVPTEELVELPDIDEDSNSKPYTEEDFACWEHYDWYRDPPDAKIREFQNDADSAERYIRCIKYRIGPWENNAEQLCATMRRAEAWFGPMATKLDHWARKAVEMRELEELIAVTLDTDELPPRERMKDIGDGLLSVGSIEKGRTAALRYFIKDIRIITSGFEAFHEALLEEYNAICEDRETDYVARHGDTPSSANRQARRSRSPMHPLGKAISTGSDEDIEPQQSNIGESSSRGNDPTASTPTSTAPQSAMLTPSSPLSSPPDSPPEVKAATLPSIPKLTLSGWLSSIPLTTAADHEGLSPYWSQISDDDMPAQITGTHRAIQILCPNFDNEKETIRRLGLFNAYRTAVWWCTRCIVRAVQVQERAVRGKKKLHHARKRWDFWASYYHDRKIELDRQDAETIGNKLKKLKAESDRLTKELDEKKRKRLAWAPSDDGSSTLSSPPSSPEDPRGGSSTGGDGGGIDLRNVASFGSISRSAEKKNQRKFETKKPSSLSLSISSRCSTEEDLEVGEELERVKVRSDDKLGSKED